MIGFETEPFHNTFVTTEYSFVACPLTDTTRGLVNSAAFATPPPSAVLANVEGGPIVKTDAVVEAPRTQFVKLPWMSPPLNHSPKTTRSGG